jgi:hypothetical protein
MKNIKRLMGYVCTIVMVLVCTDYALSSNSVVVDFTRTDRGGSKTMPAPVPGRPVIPIVCDVRTSWTCNFVGSDDLANKSIDGVATAHINADGSMYLQEASATVGVVTSDYWSVTLPAWYVSNGVTSYTLLGTDCTFTIKPVVTAGSVTDWTLKVRGKTVVTGKGPADYVDTCGGDTEKEGKKGKSPLLKTGPSGKGPGPK